MEIKVVDFSGQEIPCVMTVADDILMISVNVPMLFKLEQKKQEDKVRILSKQYTHEELDKIKNHMSFFLDDYKQETFEGGLKLHEVYMSEKKSLNLKDPTELELLNKRYVNLILKLI